MLDFMGIKDDGRKLKIEQNEQNFNDSYIKNIFSNIIGNELKIKTPYGEKKVVYSDYTGSGRAITKIEEFISKEILPYYANVHSASGFLSEQTENFRDESKTIIRRYFNTDEKDSIIFSGQGTTACINKVIKLVHLGEHVLFYKNLKMLSKIQEKFKKFTKEEFLDVNTALIDEIKLKWVELFEISNFCFKNRWGSYDCVLCRMTFLQESQYNDHQKSEVHVVNLEKCARVNETIFKPDIKSYSNSEDFIFELLLNYEKFEPIIFLSLLEHNSNALPWRETGARVVYIECDDINSTNSDFNYEKLENELSKYKNHFIKIGSFTGLSNITGVYLDTDYISLILHKHNTLAFFDLAATVPYLKVDMNKPLPKDYRKALGFTREFTPEEETLVYKDSIFFSPHKLLGGQNTPGVLIIKQHVVRNLLVPSEPGGGVVLFVRKERANYARNIEVREEAGTPDIIGSIRVGLALILREKFDNNYILQKDDELNEFIFERMNRISNLFIIGNLKQKRISLFSFVIKFNGRLLHPNFVSALLNDLFGIQSRPGCSCASTYGVKCLGLGEEYLENLEELVCSGSEIFRPGYTRVNFPFFYPDYIVDYILSAIEFIAKYGWLFLYHYAFKIESGKYYHRNEEEEKRKWLNEIYIDKIQGNIVLPELIKDKQMEFTKEILEEQITGAENILKDFKNITKHVIGKSKLNLKILFDQHEASRWFLLPDDVDEIMFQIELDKITNSEYDNQIRQYREKKLIINFDLENICGKNLDNRKEFNLCNVDNNNLNTNNLDSRINIEHSHLEGLDKIVLPDPKKSNKIIKDSVLFPQIPKKIVKLVGEASKDFDMLKDGDKILVGMSGGKDSTSLLHILLYFQKKVPFKIEIAGVTVDPQSSDYDPSPLIDYMKQLNVKYFFERDPILERAKKNLQNDSICAYCARMKRGIIYNCARREGYNVIALGQHLDDLGESFLMSSFHNGLLRTMKANYIIDQGDLRVIRPLIYCREKLFKEFTLKNRIPIIQENCPACFSAPKERHRVKVLLAQQENMFPNLFSSLQKAMVPLMKGLIEAGNKKDDLDI